MTAYYNEFDPHAAQWLRNLISRGLIAPGEVDERSIEDVTPDDLRGFTQCHFFSGVGVWSYALRLAGWDDDRPVWTGSPPCQPFSQAGQQKGTADDRHLWPAFYRLIEARRPECILGEQVSAAIRHGWLDDVFNDLEGIGYTCGAVAVPACSVGAPHIRERLFFVGHTERFSAGRNAGAGVEAQSGASLWPVGDDAGPSGANGLVAHPESLGLLGRPDDRDDGRGQRTSGQRRAAGELGDTLGARLQGHGGDGDNGHQPGWIAPQQDGSVAAAGATLRPGPTNGFWRDADWLGCTDGKWRPVKPGSQCLVDGASFRMGSGSAFEGKSRAKMLKGYGNAIVAPLAAEFISAVREYLDHGV